MIAGRGHELGNHSMTHPDLHRVSPWRLYEELRDCQECLRSICAAPVTAFRAPHGHFRWEMRFAARLGLRNLVKWDVAPPWKETDPAKLAGRILSTVKPGSIILLHDGLAHRDEQLSAAVGAATAECISLIAPEIRSRGVKFKTISELLPGARRSPTASAPDRGRLAWGSPGQFMPDVNADRP
jgi:chitooligosaccharide deacetylase